MCRADENGFRYKEAPAIIEEFVLSDYYLNMSKSIRPAVLQDLKDLFSDPSAFAYCPYEKAVFDEAVGSGKCHGKGTPILMYDGEIKMVEDVQVGDMVMGPDSEPRRVQSLSRGYDDMYEIVPIKGEPFVVNGDHILSLKRTNKGIINTGRPNGGKQDGQAGGIVDISVKDYLSKSKNFKNNHKLWRTGVRFPNEGSVTMEPYLLGVWLGDGSSHHMGVTTKDPEMKEYLYDIAEQYDLSINVDHNKDKTCPTYILSSGVRGQSNVLLDALKAYNLIKNKHVPKIYRTNSRNVRLDVLAGLIDTDGHLSGGCYEFSNKNKRLCEDTAFIARSLGFAAYVKERTTTCNGKRFRSYRVSISGCVSEIPVRIPRKKTKPRLQKKSVLVTGFSVTEMGRGKYYGFNVDRGHLYLLGDFTVTHNSYKTSIILAYYIHHLLCMENPHESFHIDENDLIAILNMSVNAIQAKKVVFGGTQSRINNSPWFQDHKPDPNIKSELRFENHICMIPGHSGSNFPLGYNLIAAVMDEAAYYTVTKEHDVASDMFYTLDRRIKTRFDFHGLLVMISQPRYVDDFIEKQAKGAETDDSIFCKRRAIWEVRVEDIEDIERGDYFTLNDGEKDHKIPNKYKKDFEKNPEKSWRDYGARPSLALERYLKRWKLVQDIFVDRMRDPVDEDGRFFDWFVGDPDESYYIHIDLGLKRDRAGIGMGHAESQTIIIDLAHHIEAPEDGEIDLADIRDTVVELRKRGFDIEIVTYDQFQSASSLQELRKKDFIADRQSVESLEACENYKEQIYQGRVRTYPNDVLEKEMGGLELIKGKKVDHPTTGSKDVWDATCGVVNHLLENEIMNVMEVE